MNLNMAFLVATAFCYLSAFFLTYLGKPPMKDNSIQMQTMYMFCFITILYSAYNPNNVYLNIFMGLFYSFASVGSYIGYPQIWNAYWKNNPEEGSATGQVIMALWNLAISMIYFSLC